MKKLSNIYLNGTQLEYIEFNPLEIQLIVPQDLTLYIEQNSVEFNPKVASDLVLLSQLKFILDEERAKDTILIMPYVPFARYDRKFNNRDALSLKIFCQSINNLNFSSVHIEDPHSTVTENLLDRCVVKTQLDIFKANYKALGINLNNYTALIAPDVGASKKTEAIANFLEKPTYQAHKTRNANNSISDTFVYYDTRSNFQEDVLIVDDIIEFGSSVTALAKHLKQLNPLGRVDVYVTHGLLPVNNRLDTPSRFKAILEYVDNLYIKNLWYLPEHSETNVKVSYKDLY